MRSSTESEVTVTTSQEKMDYRGERRNSRSRALERSLSYSEAVGSGSGLPSIGIPSIADTEVYTNEEIKKHYRISQTYVEGKEISFPTMSTNFEINSNIPSDLPGGHISQYSSEDETTDDGLIMTIDVETESPKTSDTRHISTASTQPMVSSLATSDVFDRIEYVESVDTTTSQNKNFTTFSKRKKRNKRIRTECLVNVAGNQSHPRNTQKLHNRRQHGRPIRSRRAVLKSGEENVPVRSNIPSKSMKYMRDIFNTVINSKWRFIILLVFAAHFAFWLFFAGIWYAVSSSYQDDIGDGKEHCITGTSSFAGLLMMSVETQMTIGYGVRFPNEECPEAIIIMVLEIVAGTALSGGLMSLLFTKLIRPNKHVSFVGFSKNAAICLRDGALCLQFRVWDLLHHHTIGSTVTAYMLKPIRTLEGEMVQNYIHPLKLNQARAFLLWPITVVHIIDAESPLYDFSAQDMMDYRFEIVVCVTGSAKNMGTMTQSRTSYLSKEIMWGYRFKNVLRYSKKKESYIIDTENLNTVEQVETPLCSASLLKEFEVDFKSSMNLLSTTEITSTNMSLTQDDSSTLSRVGDSVSSTPNFGRGGTQKSFGWNFKRFRPDTHVRGQEKDQSF